MLLLGIDIGTSSIKVSVVDSQTSHCIASAQFPDSETLIDAPKPGWAEQDPEMWWKHFKEALDRVNTTGKFKPTDIGALGIAYQMHGLVMVDKDQRVIRPSIIWCDSRAVGLGQQAFETIGTDFCLQHLLNSPGNFTASKLAWVKQNEPENYNKTVAIMLPGDFMAMKLTGEIGTTISALSEGVFWDFERNALSQEVLSYFGIDESLIPTVRPVFSNHGALSTAAAKFLGLTAGIPVTYKAGDQPNNALSLNVMEPAEVAATAGTSGVIYAVGNNNSYDPKSRVNGFAHVNHSPEKPRIGTLLCINGTGIANGWSRRMLAGNNGYSTMNEQAKLIPMGSNGLLILPFGNGAERMLENKTAGAQMLGIDFNLHTDAHIFRAVQEGIAFSFKYGIDLMRENGLKPKVIRAGKANMFLSSVFTDAFVNTLQIPVELYNNDGSVGAALGAGIGAGVYSEAAEAFSQTKPVQTIEPNGGDEYAGVYERWKKALQVAIK